MPRSDRGRLNCISPGIPVTSRLTRNPRVRFEPIVTDHAMDSFYRPTQPPSSGSRKSQFLTIELDLGYVLRSLEVQDLPGVEVIETWEYADPLSWHIAQAIRADCEHDAPQGLLYSETATTLLALQVIRGLSNRGDAVKVHRRGGISPAD